MVLLFTYWWLKCSEITEIEVVNCSAVIIYLVTDDLCRYSYSDRELKIRDLKTVCRNFIFICVPANGKTAAAAEAGERQEPAAPARVPSPARVAQRGQFRSSVPW